MNRAQRRAAGLKGKRYKKFLDEYYKTAMRTYVAVSTRHVGKAVGEAIYNRLKGELK
jgi:hypothetical protein